MTSPQPPTARDRITSRLVRQAKRFPDLDLASVDTSDLDARDAALARAIEHAALRRWLTLTTIIDHVLDQSWSRLQPNVQAPLLAGSAQLLLLDRLPEHAVINEAVRWTKQHARTRAGGLVNAVLRRVSSLRREIVPQHDPARLDELPLHDGRAWRLVEPVFPADDLDRLAVLTSHPLEVIRRWVDRHGRDEAVRLAYHNLVHPPIIVTGLTPEVAATESHLAPHDQPGFFVFDGPHDELTALLKRHPDSRVQDPTAAEAVVAARQMAPDLVIDYCAGVGTKTAQLLAQFPSSPIIATDRNPARLEILRQAFHDHARVDIVDFERTRDHDGRADLLLLDVPCSNSGVLARRVEARYRLGAASIEGLVAIQRQIVADSLALLAPSGRILYATCSIETEENEDQAAWLCKWHPYRIVQAASRLPRGGPGDPPARYRDGGFHALLEPIA